MVFPLSSERLFFEVRAPARQHLAMSSSSQALSAYATVFIKGSASLHFSSLLVTKTLVSSGGRAGLTRRATEAPAGVLVQYVEEAEEAQRSQDGSFRRCSREVMRNAG